MAGSKGAKTPIDETFEDARAMLNANPFLGPQVQHLWDAQEYVFGETEAYAADWLARRQVAARTAVDIAKALAANRSLSPAPPMKALVEWQTGAAARVADDVREWLALWSRCANYLVRAETEAGEEGMERALKATASKKRRKDDLPV